MNPFVNWYSCFCNGSDVNVSSKPDSSSKFTVKENVIYCFNAIIGA